MKYFSVFLLIITIIPIIFIPIAHYQLIDLTLFTYLFNAKNILIKENDIKVFFQYINIYILYISGLYLGINFNSDDKKTIIIDLFSIIILLIFFIDFKNQKIIIIFIFFIFQVFETLFYYMKIIPKNIFITRAITNIILLVSATLINLSF